MEFWLHKLSPLGGQKNRAGLKRWGTGLSLRVFPLGCLVFGLMLAFSSRLFAENETGGLNAAIVPINGTNINYGVGSWIWASETHDQQYCRLWKEFEIPRFSTVISARLRITADNTYRLFVDGREIGRGGDWRDLTEYDLTLLMEPGRHVLAVEAFNTFDIAGVLAGLHVSLADGREMEILSDPGWCVVPDAEHGWETKTRAEASWPAATVIKGVGVPPWNHRLILLKAAQIQPIIYHFWQTGWFLISLFSLCVLIAVICVRLLGKLALHVQASHVIQRERARIARDLHDDLTSGLTQLVLLGEIARNELPTASPSHQQVGRVCDKTRSLLRSLNEIIWVVNSQRDTLQDFASFVCKYAETFTQPTTVRCRFELEEQISDLPCDLGMRRNLFLAVKEALNNVVRHSAASEVILRIRQQEMMMVMVIEDNGKGFVPAEADRERNGLSNMMKRAADAGGICRIISQPGSGCRIEFTVPLTRRVSGRFWQGWWPSGNKIKSAATARSSASVNHSTKSRL
ncbi:MAG TPA: ATP-binding protein [Verrucomicrobiae bacterium]|jgi:anti-sigma regulatory factor (Ser/Thr protein kinase)